MSIWFKDYTIEELEEMFPPAMDAHIGIEMEEIGPDYLRFSMPVDQRTKQPYGMLHGGASVVLAESVGSVAANLTVDLSKQYCVGLDINANHLRAKRDGRVFATGKPVHIGRTTQVWSIEIVDEEGKKVCISRITMAVMNRK
jgi:1,4-dihydroxy-2-naphthoyl-CoA hydrolase